MIYKEPDIMENGKDLAVFLEQTFPITETEGDKLIDYMEGHGFLLGYKDGELYRGNMRYVQEETLWEPYSIDDAVNAAFEWNDELIRETQEEIENLENADEIKRNESCLASLREDEAILDMMFDRTKYGKEIEELAEKLAERLLQDMRGEGGIDTAIKKMEVQMKASVDLLPDVSPALKSESRGRR